MESVSGMDDVSVTGKAGKEVLHALEQRVHLTVDEHFHHQVFACPLHQLLSCWILHEKKIHNIVNLKAENFILGENCHLTCQSMKLVTTVNKRVHF